jgi:hypothetical protein
MHELVEKPDLPQKYKTKECASFHGPKKYCPYGTRCQYIHSKEELIRPKKLVTFKQSMISNNQNQSSRLLSAIREEISSTTS